MYRVARWFGDRPRKHLAILALTSAIVIVIGFEVVNGVRPKLPLTSHEQQMPKNLAPAQTPLIFTNLADLLREKPDPERLAALVRLSRLVGQPEPQGEFETDEEYEKRLTSFAAPVGPYPRDTQFAIILPISSVYSLEAGRLTVSADAGGVMAEVGAAPTITLSTGSLPTTSYVGQNAFGVSRRVDVHIEQKLILIPIARISGPPGCDFSAGGSKAGHRTTLVDAESLVRWACGPRYVETDEIESLATINVPLSVPAAREAKAQALFLAYIVSFDTPVELEAHAGPMTYSSHPPTVNNPIDKRIVGEAMTMRLKRVIVYTPDSKVWLDRTFD